MWKDSNPFITWLCERSFRVLSLLANFQHLRQFIHCSNFASAAQWLVTRQIHWTNQLHGIRSMIFNLCVRVCVCVTKSIVDFSCLALSAADFSKTNVLYTFGQSHKLFRCGFMLNAISCCVWLNPLLSWLLCQYWLQLNKPRTSLSLYKKTVLNSDWFCYLKYAPTKCLNKFSFSHVQAVMYWSMAATNCKLLFCFSCFSSFLLAHAQFSLC